MAGRHQRKAVLPGAGYSRPASLDDTGLVVTVYGENGGVEGTFDFTGLAGGVELRRAFAAAFDRKSGQGGTWRAWATCQAGYQSVREFLRGLAAQDRPPQAVSEITPAVWAAWRMALPANSSARTYLADMRALLPEVRGLPAETLQAADRRLPQAAPPAETAYTYPEFTQIRSCAAGAFTSALVRIRANREHLRRWYAGDFAEGGTDWLVGEALDHLVRTGDVPVKNLRRAGRQLLRRYRVALGGNAPEATWGRLHLTRTEVAAAAVLLVASEAWNRSVLDRMRVPGYDPAAGDDDVDIHMVEIDKRRRPVRLRYTTNNLLDSGPGSPGRLLSQVIEATDTSRQTLALLGRPTDRLLVCRLANPAQAGEVFGLGVPREVAVPAAPVPVSLRRLRRTVQVLIRREPAQNTRETHESTYVLPDPASHAEAKDTIAQGLADAVAHARAVATMRAVLGGDADVLVEFSDDPALATAIARGDLDTATAACTDFTHSPFTEPGRGCTASFLLCLACPNAVATRRHLPRLAYLREALDALRATLDAAVWAQDWHEHFLRVSCLLEAHTTPAERSAARAQLSDPDQAMIDRLLRRGLDP